MPNITDDELVEYRELRGFYLNEKFREIQESVNSIANLEDDIDVPIKKCVAMFALLGCKPQFSCCGFNYIGQPIHKCHQYGRIVFLLGDKINSYGVLSQFNHSWIFTGRPDCLDFSVGIENFVPDWREITCVHYPETAVWLIDNLEKYLLNFKNMFVSEISLQDGNKQRNEVSRYWQYPAKQDWLITKEWVLNGLV